MVNKDFQKVYVVHVNLQTGQEVISVCVCVIKVIHES